MLIYETPYITIILVWQIHVRLTINMHKKKYSIILGIICHSLRKLNPSEHMPKYPFINFWDPKGKYFWIWVICVTLTMILKNIPQ